MSDSDAYMRGSTHGSTHGPTQSRSDDSNVTPSSSAAAIQHHLDNQSLSADAVNSAPMDEDVAEAIKIVRAPAARATGKRYEVPIRMCEEILREMKIDPENIDTSGQRDRSKDPVAAGLKLILRRCSPKDEGRGYEGLSASATGTACKSAVVAFWRLYGYFSNFTEYPDGSFSGNPGTCQELHNLINKLHTAQVQQGTHKVTRAYQETHEDVRTITKKFFDPFILQALEKSSSVDYLLLQASVINCLQFGAIARADEILSIRVEDLVYSGEAPDSSVAAVLQVTKNRRTQASYLVFERAVHRGFCALEKLLMWQAVLLSHGIRSGPMFLAVSRNELQPNRALNHKAYAQALKAISLSCGLPTLQEHSARRGGLGYQYFVLRRDLLFLYRAHSWEDMTEMIKYLGLEDEVNSYALLGFSCLRINEVN